MQSTHLAVALVLCNMHSAVSQHCLQAVMALQGLLPYTSCCRAWLKCRCLWCAPTTLVWDKPLRPVQSCANEGGLVWHDLSKPSACCADLLGSELNNIFVPLLRMRLLVHSSKAVLPCL